VKRSGRDEPMWGAIHKCMEAMLGISLYSYLYLKLAKMLCFSYYLLCFLFNKVREQEGRTGSAWKWGPGGGGPSNVSSCEKEYSTFLLKLHNEATILFLYILN
jgi:hypothetical protein